MKKNNDYMDEMIALEEALRRKNQHLTVDEYENEYDDEYGYEYDDQYGYEYDDQYDNEYDDEYDDEYGYEEDHGDAFLKKVSILLVCILCLGLCVIACLVFFRNKDDGEKASLEAETTEQVSPVATIEALTSEVVGSIKEGVKEVTTPKAPEIDTPKQTQDTTSPQASEEQTEVAPVNPPTIENPYAGQGLLTAHSAGLSSTPSQGIDVSKYQGVIDYQQVAQNQIDFVMIRVGYRDMKNGAIEADVNAKYNLQQALQHGLKVGAYFFSSAITKQEAIDEANWVADYLSQYAITYPVAFDGEGFQSEKSRHHGLSMQERTEIAIAFMNQIYNRGYTPMFYASAAELSDGVSWQTSALKDTYRIWVAQYQEGDRPSVDFPYAMWQKTDSGTLPGISGKVDYNTAYFSYDQASSAQSDITPEVAQADPEALMQFTDTQESVTAKEVCNLRSFPDQENGPIIHALRNGETALRTGISESGWSRVLWEGQTLYVVSSLVTTDLSYVPAASTTPEQVEVPEDTSGLKTTFEARNDTVTAKIEVNLRTLPSVTNEASSVVAVLKNGEYITRTGINSALGWSRVDYNGQTLYCISSYLTQ